MVRDKHLVLDEQVKLYIPLWWHGQKSEIPDSSPTHCDLTPSGAYFKKHGYWFDGTDDYFVDSDSRKVLNVGTAGEWSSILLTDGDVPEKGSIWGTGTKLCLNDLSTNPKITGKIILHSEYCPNLTYLRCKTNSISVLDVSDLTSLTYIRCDFNSISVLDVSDLTSLTVLMCAGNLISVLSVSALTLLNYFDCASNSMNQAMVDTVLCDMDGHGTNNGILNISSNAAPSAAGTTCANNLTGRGWTVTTD